jgi:sarcosine oxidase subunit gamma
MLETRPAVRRLPSTESATAIEISVHPARAAARFSLRLDPADARALGTVGGFRLDLPINRCVASGERVAARLGPNEWLLLGPEPENEAIAGQIDTALAGHFYALVNIGHRDRALEVSGRHAAEVLNAGCPLDLAWTAFPAGCATRTLLGKAEIVLMCMSEAPAYRVECGRSFGRYVHDFLLAAAREIEPPVR